MADLQKGVSFEDGDTVYPADLNNLVDNGTILPAFISAKLNVVPATVDSFIYYQSGSGLLRRCTLTNLISAFPRDDTADTYSLRRLGTTALKAAAGNDTRFPASVTGLRLGAGVGSSDTVAHAKDVSFPETSMVGDTSLDWDDGDVFTDSLTGDKTYTFANLRNGRTITLIIRLNGHTATLPNGTAVNTVGTGTTFWYIVMTKSSLGAGAVGFGVLV